MSHPFLAMSATENAKLDFSKLQELDRDDISSNDYSDFFD